MRMQKRDDHTGGRARRTILVLLRAAGVLSAWRRLNPRQLTILTGHGVMGGGLQPALWEPLRPQLAPGRLDRYLSVIGRHHRFASLLHAEDMLSGRSPFEAGCVVLTFDDGYRNNLTHALPVLKRHGAPATFFLATGHVERRRPFWFDRLDYALQQAPVDGLEATIGGVPLRLRASDRRELQASYKRLRDAAKSRRREDSEMRAELEALAARLEQAAGRSLQAIFEDDDWSAVASWDEIAAAARDPLVAFGSHTVDHVRLALADDEVVRDQLERSGRTIEQRAGRPCRHVCYPSGSVSARVARIARECGYTCGVTTREGVSRPGDDLLTLRRVNLPLAAGDSEILALACGFSDAFGRLRRRLRGRRGDPDPAAVELGVDY
jgi:peptidoglycan/xylan/chitin deacetylase (PgdA/CDA1 family)